MGIDNIDRISLLPDCLVIEILSRLDNTKYAIRTGTLSKRWQHLWPQLSNLFFTHETCRNIPKFYSSLERILRIQTHQLNKLKLHAYFNDRTEVSICIRSAISRNVQEVDLRMTRTSMTRYVLRDYFFTCSSFTRVSLCGCYYDQADVVSWENLRTLHIEGTDIDQNVFENILSGSPLLETLELAYCSGIQSIDILPGSPLLETLDLAYCYGLQSIDITTNKSVKNLRLKNCGDIIRINAPYILSLAIKGRVTLKGLVLLNVSSVINVELNYFTGMQQILEEEEEMNDEEMQQILEEQERNEEVLKGHLLSLARAKEFIIGESCLETLSRLKAKGFVIPSNLKVLGEIASDERRPERTIT